MKYYSILKKKIFDSEFKFDYKKATRRAYFIDDSKYDSDTIKNTTESEDDASSVSSFESNYDFSDNEELNNRIDNASVMALKTLEQYRNARGFRIRKELAYYK